MIAAPPPGCPIAPLPVSDEQWRGLPTQERRRLAQQWYRTAQPLPLQRGWMPRHTRRSAHWLRAETLRRLSVLGGWQRGHRTNAELEAELGAARDEAARLRLQADSGRTLAHTVTTDLEDACSRVLELSALLLADQEYGQAPTRGLDVTDREAS